MAIVSNKSIRDPKLRWFREARFGMFIHFGIYALLGRGEWVQYHENIPRRKYEKLMRTFSLKRFNADAWVDVAEAAGCKYIVLTAKHHDGFCLFDSELTEYKITNTPFARDLVGELTDACHRRGMRIGLYYSQPDWHHSNYVHLPGAFKDLDVPPPDQQPDWRKYLRYYQGQVQELCTRYGRIDAIWFDGSHKSEKAWEGKKIYRLIKKYQPGAIVNERAGYGDLFTPERTLPEDLSGYMIEACQSVTSSAWGHKTDSSLFSVPALVETLVRLAAENGNFLLNVGPLPDGRIPHDQAEHMKAIGKWLKTHGESIYDTEGIDIDTGSSDLVSTRRGRIVYVTFCQWPDQNRIILPGIRSNATAILLAGKRRLKTRSTAKGLVVDGLPMIPPNPVMNVMKLAFARAPQLMLRKKPVSQPQVVDIARRGHSVLTAGQAALEGLGIKGTRLTLEGQFDPKPRRLNQPPAQVVSSWSIGGQAKRMRWRVNVASAGKYKVSVQLACEKRVAGSTYLVKARNDSITGVVKGTRSDYDHHWQNVGVIQLPKGASFLTLQPKDMPYGYIFANVGRLKLEPDLG